MSYIGNQPTSVAFVTDQFSGNGSTVAFTTSVAPANTASVLVSVSGVLQDPTTYSVSGLTLTFSAAPPSGTGNISCRYLGIPASGVTTTAYRTVTEFTATAGQTTFTPPSYTVGFIDVYRNGTRLGSADYTATNGTTVVLASGASSGDLVTTESFLVSSVLNAIPATAGAVSSAYIQNSVALTTPLLGTPTSGTLTNCTGLPTGGIAAVAWTSYTPTISAATGTITTASGTGQYQTIGKTCIVSMTITITTAGTGANQLFATLPFTSAARIQSGTTGAEVNTTGNGVKGYIPTSSTQLQLTYYNNSTPIGSGNTIIVTTTYETA